MMETQVKHPHVLLARCKSYNHTHDDSLDLTDAPCSYEGMMSVEVAMSWHIELRESKQRSKWLA